MPLNHRKLETASSVQHYEALCSTRALEGSMGAQCCLLHWKALSYGRLWLLSLAGCGFLVRKALTFLSSLESCDSFKDCCDLPFMERLLEGCNLIWLRYCKAMYKTPTLRVCNFFHWEQCSRSKIISSGSSSDLTVNFGSVSKRNFFVGIHNTSFCTTLAKNSKSAREIFPPRNDQKFSKKFGR